MAAGASKSYIMRKYLSLSVISALMLLAISSCAPDKCKKCKGSTGFSPIPLAKVERVIVEFSGKVRLFQDTSQLAVVRGPEIAIKNMSTRVENGTWIVRYDQCITCEEEVELTLVVPDLKSLELRSSASINAEEAISFPNFEIIQKGSGAINFASLQADSLRVTHSGSGDVVLRGNLSGALQANMTGSGVLRSFELPFQDVTVTNNASGSVFLTALNNLNVTISGSGNVHYKGAPTIIQNITGSGQLINAN